MKAVPLAGSTPPINAAARQERRQFITHNALAAAGTWGAGVFGLLLQAIVSHRFEPAEYGQAFAVFSFFTILTQPAYGFGRLVTWTTSRARATRLDEQEGNSLLRSMNLRLLVGGTLLALAFIGAAPLVATYLHVPSSFVIFGALGLPFLIGIPPLLASLQGEQRWVSWSVVSMAIAFSRIVCVLALVIPFGVSGILIGISVAAAILYLVLIAIVWPRLRRAKTRYRWRTHWRFLVLSLASGVTVSVAMGSDVVMVQHFFGAHAGGQFSAVAVTTRTLYFSRGQRGQRALPQGRGTPCHSAEHHSYRHCVDSGLGSRRGCRADRLLGWRPLILHYFSGSAYAGGAAISAGTRWGCRYSPRS